MKLEHPNTSTESIHHNIEVSHNYFDIANVEVQALLITRFFKKHHPDMILDDPDARDLAARLWVGSVNSPNSMAAIFRSYVDNMSQDSRIIDLNDTQSLDVILESLSDAYQSSEKEV